MKKRLAYILGGWVVWIFLMTLPVLADAGPHKSFFVTGTPSTSCASCHRAHTATGPELLKVDQPQLCYTCHGEVAAGGEVDVEGGVEFDSTKTTFAALRGGGFLYAVIDAANPTGQSSNPKNLTAITLGNIPVLGTRALSTSSHTVNPNDPVTMWGNGDPGVSNVGKAGVSMSCGTCHDPHGNGKYRILRPVPSGAGSGASGTDGVTPVNIADPSTKTYTTTNYWNVKYTEAPEVEAKISSWCSTCHTRYLADALSSTNASVDSVFTYRHMTQTNVAYGPICIQCHVAHGTNADMGTRGASKVALPGGIDPTTSNRNDSRLLRVKERGVCQMCHLR